MAHYAFLDSNNLVTEVITGIDETELIEGKDPEQWYSEFRNQKCVRTSYSGSIRKNYAGVAFFYDEALDAFIPPKPFDSWVLDEDTARWEAPTPYPGDGLIYQWDELLLDWTPVTFGLEKELDA
jgi:hypothetical protein